MGLRDRIFHRGGDPAGDASAPDLGAPAPQAGAPDAEAAAGPPATEPADSQDTALWTHAAGTPAGELTVVHAAPATTTAQATTDQPAGSEQPAGAEQPTVVQSPPAASAEAAPQGTAQAAQAPPEGFVPDPGAAAAVPRRPGFRDRGRLRRRLRFLREVRELGFRDLGGLVFDQHRFQRPNEALVQGKVAAIDAVDQELRAIEDALQNRTPYSELFIPGVSACQRCGALHGSDARFCPYCGLAFAGPRAVAGIGPDQAAYGTPGAATPPGQAVLFDPHTGAPIAQPQAPAAPAAEGAQPRTPYQPVSAQPQDVSAQPDASTAQAPEPYPPRPQP